MINCFTFPLALLALFAGIGVFAYYEERKQWGRALLGVLLSLGMLTLILGDQLWFDPGVATPKGHAAIATHVTRFLEHTDLGTARPQSDSFITGQFVIWNVDGGGNPLMGNPSLEGHADSMSEVGSIVLVRKILHDSGVYRSTSGGDEKALRSYEYEAWIFETKTYKLIGYKHFVPEEKLPNQVSLTKSSMTSYEWDIQSYLLGNWIEALYRERRRKGD